MAVPARSIIAVDANGNPFELIYFPVQINNVTGWAEFILNQSTANPITPTNANLIGNSNNTLFINPSPGQAAAVALFSYQSSSAAYRGYNFGLNGTLANPVAILAGSPIVTLQGFAYDGTTTGLSAALNLRAAAAENWTNTAHGAYLEVLTVPNTTTATVIVARFQDGLQIFNRNTGPTGGDKGGGTINVQSGYYIQGTNLAGNLPATATNDNANAGNVGEFVSSNVNAAQTNNTLTNLTTISLTAGDWDVFGSINYQASGNVLTDVYCCISTTSLDATQNNMLTAPWYRASNIAACAHHSATPPPLRVSITSTTTVYLVAYCIFASGSATALGAIRARRVR